MAIFIMVITNNKRPAKFVRYNRECLGSGSHEFVITGNVITKFDCMHKFACD